MKNNPEQDNWQFNELQCIASHNSYEKRYLPKLQFKYIDEKKKKYLEEIDQRRINKNFNKNLDWRFESIRYQLENCKVRGLEFDIHEKKIGKEKIFYVYHYLKLSKKMTIEEWLEAVKIWADIYNSKNELKHEPIIMYFDLKKIKSLYDFPISLDKIIEIYFDENQIYTPTELDEYMKKNNNQWPTLDFLRGKFIFVLSGGNKEGLFRKDSGIGWAKQKYFEEGRLAFVDVSPTKIHDFPDRKFINTFARAQTLTLSADKIEELIFKGKIIRTWMTNNEIRLFDIMDKGINLLGTDKISNYVKFVEINPLVLSEDSGYQKRWSDATYATSLKRIYSIGKRIYNLEKKNNLNFILFGIIMILLLIIIIFRFFQL